MSLAMGRRHIKLKILLVFLVLLFLVSCGNDLPPPAAEIEVRTLEIARPEPIVPPIDQLQLRTVEWVVVTQENVAEVFASLEGSEVLYALTTRGYEDVSLNLSDIRATIEQQQVVLRIYRDSFR